MDGNPDQGGLPGELNGMLPQARTKDPCGAALAAGNVIIVLSPTLSQACNLVAQASSSLASSGSTWLILLQSEGRVYYVPSSQSLVLTSTRGILADAKFFNADALLC